MTERRYTDEEVAEIFARAAQIPQTPPLGAPSTEGLTLGALQEIGREVGLAPEAVAKAAQSLAVRAEGEPVRFLGLPISVERTVALERRLTDQEWEQLVVQFRQVFRARGTLRSDGSFRQWTNGNLQALLEPTATGHRLRLRTLQGSALASMRAGLALAAIAVVTALAVGSGGDLRGATPGILMILSIGVGLFASGALRLPGWARLRGRQMDSIATGLAESVHLPPPEAPRIAKE